MASLRGQQDVQLQIIVVDDHSTDSTVEIVQRHMAEDPRIRLVRPKTRGGGSARNVGASLANTEYLAFADGDDLVPPGAYAALTGSLATSGSDLAIGDFFKFSAYSSWRPSLRWRAFSVPRSGISLRDLPSLIRNRSCWNRVFRLDFWRAQEITFPDVPRSNDIVPMTTALVSARRLDVVPDIVYLYRERPGAGSMTAASGSAASLRSYLQQEVRCSRRVSSAGRIRAEYDNLVFLADGWVHVRRALVGWTGWPRHEEVRIADALTELFTRADQGFLSHLNPAFLTVMKLLARGESNRAAELLGLIENGWGVPDQILNSLETTMAVIRDTLDSPTVRLRALARLVVDRLVQSAGDVSLDVLEVCVGRVAPELERAARLSLADVELAPITRRAVDAVIERNVVTLASLGRLANEEFVVDAVTATPGGLRFEGNTDVGSFASFRARLDGSKSEAVALPGDITDGRWSVIVKDGLLRSGRWRLTATIDLYGGDEIELAVTSAEKSPVVPHHRWARMVVLPRSIGEVVTIVDRGDLTARGLRRLGRYVRR